MLTGVEQRAAVSFLLSKYCKRCDLTYVLSYMVPLPFSKVESPLDMEIGFGC